MFRETMFSLIRQSLYKICHVSPLSSLQGPATWAPVPVGKHQWLDRKRDILGSYPITCKSDTSSDKTSAQHPKETEEFSSNVNKLLDEAKSHVDDEPPAEFPSDIINENEWERNQMRHAFRPEVDPQETSILLFPGQGSQFVGMAKDLLQYPNVIEMFEIAGQILRYDLLKICLNGPKENLDKTVHCQPAIFVTSLAAVEKLKVENPQAIENCISTAGFSVGEYAALVFAGALSFEDAVEVVKVRAEAMQRASQAVPSGMMTTFLGADNKLKMACHTARQYCSKQLEIENPVCEVANYLYPECKVIAGNMEALDFIEENQRDFGIRRCKRLPVSGAFHTKLMKPAQKPLERILQHIKFRTPIIPVHSNVTAFKYRYTKSIKSLLVDQVTNPVKWEQTMQILYSRKQGTGFPHTYELGPGQQLGTLLKMTNLKAYKDYHVIDV